MPNEETDKPEEKTTAESIPESAQFVVDMLNNGQARVEDVYPGGYNRYHGD